MVLSGTPYFRATAQMELELIMAITTSARTLAGYFFPRPCRPGTVFLQYFRCAIPGPPSVLMVPVYRKPPHKKPTDFLGEWSTGCVCCFFRSGLAAL